MMLWTTRASLLLLLLFCSSLSSVYGACTTDEWELTTGTAEAIEEASYYGDCGLKITMQEQSATFQNPAYVQDGTPTQEPQYAARWYMNTDNLTTTGEPSELMVFWGIDPTGVVLFEVGYQICTGQATVFAKAGAGNPSITDNIVLQPGFNEITVFWDNTGTIRLRVAGVGESSKTFPATTALLDRVKLGAVTGTFKLYSGSIYFDSFASTRGVDPGPEVNVCSGTLVTLRDYTFKKSNQAICKADRLEFDNVRMETGGAYGIHANEFSVTGPFVVESGATLSVGQKF